MRLSRDCTALTTGARVIVPELPQYCARRECACASVVSVVDVFPCVLLLTHDDALPALAEAWLTGRRWLSGW